MLTKFLLTMQVKKIMIIGIGNLILKDEGVGIHVVRELRNRQLPPEIDVIDGGNAMMELLSILQEADNSIIIDALRAGGKPGTIYRFSPQDLMNATERPLSLHQVDLLDVLGIAKILDGNAHVVIIGIEPKEISWGMDLTPPVRHKVPNVIDVVLKEIEKIQNA